eukprot:m.80620 g.80620  ORF g.80620 m.80620 type:complete len:484 (-) comp10917_c0_seq2:78-1529(-)
MTPSFFWFASRYALPLSLVPAETKPQTATPHATAKLSRLILTASQCARKPGVRLSFRFTVDLDAGWLIRNYWSSLGCGWRMPRKVAKGGGSGSRGVKAQGNGLNSGGHTAVADDKRDGADGGESSNSAGARDLQEKQTIPIVINPAPDYLFEMFFLFFLIVYLLLQNYNVHFDAVDQYNRPFIAFTAFFFTKRVTWRFMDSAGQNGTTSIASKAVRFFLTGIPLLAMVKSGAELVFQHDPPTLLYLMYPYWLHVSLFGASGVDGLKKYSAEELNSDPAAGIMLGFRQQMKHILYGSLEAGYFVAVLPIRFLMDRHAVFDHRTGTLLAFYGIVNAGVLLSTNLISHCHTDLQTQTKAIGCWKEIKSAGGGVELWTSDREWKRGDQVRHNKKLYIAEAPINRAEPDDWIAWLFYRMFRHPRLVITNIVLLEVGVIVTQVAILCVVRKWQAVASWAVLITSSYLVLLYSLRIRRKVITAMQTKLVN